MLLQRSLLKHYWYRGTRASSLFVVPHPEKRFSQRVHPKALLKGKYKKKKEDSGACVCGYEQL